MDFYFSRIRPVILAAVSFLLCLVSSSAGAVLDAPHRDAFSAGGCLACHDMAAYDQPKLIPTDGYTADPGNLDWTVYNTVCWGCHDGVTLGEIQTHSSREAGSTDYGNWSVECWVCHNQHSQEQMRTYSGGRFYFSGSSAYSGSSAGVTTTTITVAGNPWSADQYAGYIVVPNISVIDANYSITGNTTNTLTVQGPIDLARVTAGDTFAIVYGRFIRSRITLDNIIDQTLPAPYVRTGFKTVKFPQSPGPGFVDKVNSTPQGICQVCHTQTAYWLSDGTRQTHFSDRLCSDCHFHKDGFIHGAGGTGCEDCHGHEDLYGGAPIGTYKGSTQSHSTRTESDDDFIGPRPILDCNDCHNTSKFPFFRSKGDANAELTLAQTDICNDCHSPDGPYDGLNDPVIGAKNNWRDGIYDGTVLAEGKERWCVTCHDSGNSTIGGRLAPNVAGDNVNYGYYISGHGAAGQECNACHDFNTLHNFDNKKTFEVPANNYQTGFRLKDVGGQQPMNIPKTTGNCSTFTLDDYRLCLSCHDAKMLLQDTKTRGVYSCTSNPFNITNDPTVTAITTGFRNESTAGYNNDASDTPHNIHWDHLGDVSTFLGGNYAYFDDLKTSNAKLSCPSCHNPHGTTIDGTNPTKRMTHQVLEVTWNPADANGEYGSITSAGLIGSVCSFQCHGNDKYYRPNPSISLNSITVADSNSSDPAPAETGYTNDLAVDIISSFSFNTPTEILIAEDPADLATSVWDTYASPYTYVFSTGVEGTKHIYCKVRFGTEESEIRHASIIYDNTPPAVTGSTLTSPGGGETWIQDSVHDITWGTLTDDNLKTAPISLDYSTDSGSTHPNSIATDESNDGTYPWTVPAEESSAARVRVTATDKAGNQSADESDSDFIIAPVTPVLSSITATDNDATPAPAEAGYTNNRSIAVTISASNNPVEMKVSEDPTFGDTPVWSPFSAATTFTITSAGDGSKRIYCIVRNGAGTSDPADSTIVLDTSAPLINPTTLIAPNGDEFWTDDTDQTITWNPANIIEDPAKDDNLKAAPITLEYSTDSGGTYPNVIATDESNDGSFIWRTPTAASYYAKVRLTATDKAGNQVSETSADNFFLSPPSDLIVTTTSDSDDGASPWSLREAINNANALGGNQPVWFNIPGADINFINGTAIITIGSNLPEITAPNITIDGESQRAINTNTNSFGPVIRIDGTSDTLSGISVAATGTNAYIRELQLTNLGRAVSTIADGTVVEDCHMGVASDTGGYTEQTNSYHVYLEETAGVKATNARIGNSGAGNYLSCANGGLWTYGVYDEGQGNRIINNIIGLMPDSTLCTTPESAIYVNPPVADNTNCLVQDNVIAGSAYGVYLYQGVGDCAIKGNMFGLTYTPETDTWTSVGPQTYAIYLWNQNTNAGNNVIGGPNVASSDGVLNDSNVINPGSYGIYDRYSYGFTGYNMIYGNFIGTSPEEDETFGGFTGIYIDYGNGTRVGGAGAGEAPNVIAHMSSYGLNLFRSTTKYVTISRNSFYDNGTEAALSDEGIFITAGSNDNITRPNITVATTTTVTVDGLASGDTVEVYLSDYDGSGTEYGEGKTFIGSAVSTGTSTDVDVSTASLSGGEWVTATRTNSFGSTSAFSSNIQVP